MLLGRQRSGLRHGERLKRPIRRCTVQAQGGCIYLVNAPMVYLIIRGIRELTPYVVQGLLANIGVSNFGIHHIEKLLQTAKVVPAVNQV